MLGFQPDNLSPIPDSLTIRWGDRPVGKIDGHDIWSVVDEARRLGIPGRPVRNPGLSEARGRALFSALSSLFSWLQRQRRVTANPCANAYQPPATKARDRVLSQDEIRWFWLACDGVGEPFKSIFRLLLLTGQRLNEVAGMSRTELRDDGTWHLRGERTKNRRAHVVPLPPLVQSIIAAMPVGDNQFIFTTSVGKPPVSWSKTKAELDRLILALAQEERAQKGERGPDMVIEPWRLHDLRRTAVTGMAELAVRPDVIELTVNHAGGSRGGIAGVYNRSELIEERRAALECWARHIERLITGAAADKVVFLHGRG